MVYIAENKLIREYDGERMMIEAYGENSLRVRVTRLKDFPEENWALIPQPEQGAKITLMRNEKEAETQKVNSEERIVGDGAVMENGKIRVILIPGKLCRKLLKYAKKKRTASGEIFLTRNGNALSRKQIWAEMKAVCESAGVERSKVFPHNLRHLFARAFYSLTHDVAKLADVLGHSSIETTRIYLISTGEEHVRLLNRLSLVLATE